jgi:hypothetical protein
VSVIDELKGFEERVARRLEELRPLVDEYRQLEEVAQRLGVSSGGTNDTSVPSQRRARQPTRNSGSSRRERTSGRRDQLLAVVKARPGITVREAGRELGVDPTSLYRIVRRLERDGALEKRGRELVAR